MITKIGANAISGILGQLQQYGHDALQSLYAPAVQTVVMQSAPRGALISGAVGAFDASTLEKDERDALIKHYGLAHDASLPLRNGVRTAIGGIGGIGAGYGAWRLISDGFDIDDPFTSGALLSGMTIAGIGAGTNIMNRYNPGAARDLLVAKMRAERKRKQQQQQTQKEAKQ